MYRYVYKYRKREGTFTHPYILQQNNLIGLEITLRLPHLQRLLQHLQHLLLRHLRLLLSHLRT